ncbi:molybdopterin-dependent oxidoreductase [Neobacillus drentensis]|uniref:molybdopterin-dependent oxidoreductase n=1 Tax=Neobacillus drentensis TaxID=220684 RepID=UPI000824F84B|nr:molybdopterin-dependent oxidoreductase [Neobacillus drentensis]
MNVYRTTQFKNVCPRNCFSACTMISHVENGRLVHITGDRNHPYTKGKLCSKGYAYVERNYHQDRLKFPYYQEVKGSGKFRQITWEKAFELIINQMINIKKQYGDFLPLVLYKYSGNFGVQHFVTEQFFSSIGKTTRIVGSPCHSAGIQAVQYDMGAVKMSDPTQVAEAGLVIIWGANPAVTNIHLIPFILEAKGRGAKIVVIDPLYTQTTELADLYLQPRPSSDGALANLLIKGLYEAKSLDYRFLEEHSIGFEKFIKQMKQIDTQEYEEMCDIPKKAINLLLSWLKEAKVVSYIIGMGLQRHSNGGQNIRAIQALAAARGDIGKKGGGIFFNQEETYVFSNQQGFINEHLNVNNRNLTMDEWITNGVTPFINQPPIEMMWISCRNPLTQEPNPQLIQNHMKKIPFVVAVEQFMTQTAKMANLVLPTTTHFEEADIVTNYWHKEIAFNQKAIPPYYESRSEWNIMRELALRLKHHSPNLCSFPIHSSEEVYLNSQFNEKVLEVFGIQSINDLEKGSLTAKLPKIAWNDQQFSTTTGKYHFYSMEASDAGLPPTPLFVEGKAPNETYPFWLITPHHPYALNSQFHFLNLTDEGEAFVAIHSDVAKAMGIFNGEIVKVFNNQGSIEIKAIFSKLVSKDILMIYQGWYPDSDVNINHLIPVTLTDMGENAYGAKGIAFYDTFVKVEKL